MSTPGAESLQTDTKTDSSPNGDASCESSPSSDLPVSTEKVVENLSLDESLSKLSIEQETPNQDLNLAESKPTEENEQCIDKENDDGKT